MPELTCPHCGELLLVSSKTKEGERARCGHCYGLTELRGGQLVVITVAVPEPDQEPHE